MPIGWRRAEYRFDAGRDKSHPRGELLAQPFFGTAWGIFAD
jgi:hypothetical protein